MATGQWNDFGESFFGLLRPPARIRPSRKNADGDVCRSQSPLTFSGKRKLSADKSYARAAWRLSRGHTASYGAVEPTAKLVFFWWGRKAHEMRSDTKPSAVPPLVNVRVTSIGRFAAEPRILVTEWMIATSPRIRTITSTGSACVPGYGLAMRLRNASRFQQDAVRRGNVEVLRKILSVPAYIRLQCGPHVVSI